MTALADAGVEELTPIQSSVLPHVLAGADVLAKAKTGTGKTFAFLVPTVERLLRSTAAPLPGGIDPVRALVLSSARELGTQIVTQAKRLGDSLPAFSIETIMGGSSIIPQRERLDPAVVGSSCPYGGAIDLMIATPGRLIEHINTTDGFAARLAACEVLVLDECDQLLDGGFQKDIEAIVAVLPAARQTLCFSATVPDKMLAVLSLAMLADYVTVDCVGDAPPSHALIEQRVVVHPLERSLLALYASIYTEVARRPSDYKVLAFLPTARQAQFSTAVLAEMGLDVLEIHSRRVGRAVSTLRPLLAVGRRTALPLPLSSLARSSPAPPQTAGERTAASDTFRGCTRKILLSSDVSARGVDYPDVTLVLQVGAPASRDLYVQRIGRTGRAGRAGSGTLLLCEYEKGFLSQLEGLPLAEGGDDALGTAEELAKVQEAAARVPDEVATQTYRAWIVAMNGQRKALKWNKAELVANANCFAREVLGRTTVPSLPRKTAAECGLAGQAGLTVEDDAPTATDAVPAAAEAAAPAFELDVKFDWPAFCKTLRKDAMPAKAAVLALSPEATMELQAALARDGEAEVGGFRILAGMVSATMVEKPISTPISRNSSAASLSNLSKVASQTSIASSSEQSATPSQMPSRIGSALDLNAAVGASDPEAPAPVPVPPPPPPSKKKASKEELKAATERMAAAGMALKEAMAAGAGVEEAQAELAAAKEAKAVLAGTSKAK